MQLGENTTPYNILAILWEVVGGDIFVINNRNLLCIVDYYSKFLVMQKVESLSARVVFGEFGLP